MDTRRVTSVIIFLLILIDLHGQGTYPEQVAEDYRFYDRLYGLDQNLINGIRYKPDFPGSEGHPFLDDLRISTGVLTINHHRYEDVRLGYNIYSQSVILEYLNFAGAPEQIVLHNDFLSEFELKQKKFKKLSFEKTGTSFFQVIEGGDLRCLYQWSKIIYRSTTSVNNFYVFSEPRRKSYLWKDGQLYGFNSKKSFIKIFETKYQKQIKQFFKMRQIQLKLISDHQMQELLRYCDELSEG